MHRRLLLSLPWLGAAKGAGAQARRYRVGVEDFEYFLPYASYGRQGYRGLGRDLLDAFAQARGVGFDYQAVPIKRRVAMLLSGDIDFAFPEHPDWQRAVKAQAAIAYAPVLAFTDGTLVRPADLGQGLARIRTLGLPNGFTPSGYRGLIAASKLRVVEVARLSTLFERLQRGELDAVYMNVRITEYFFGQQAPAGLARAVFDPDLPHSRGHWHLASHRHPGLVHDFQAFLLEHPELVSTLQKRWHWS